MEEVVTQLPLPLKSWDDLIGHELERERLARAGDFPSLLFSGQEGLGKRLVAAWLAAHRNCANSLSGSPWSCSCSNCQLVMKNQHPDLVWLERAPGKLSLGIGEIRELIHQLYLRPYQARMRVCVISEAERLTDEAQSALLKTLEEPPDANLLILVTSQESKLLPTVQSRCRITRFRPVDDDATANWLTEQGCPRERIQGFVHMAQGSPGRAQQLWQTPALWEASEKLLDALAMLPGATLGKTLELAGNCESLKIPGMEGRALLEWTLARVEAYYRDVLLVQQQMTNVSHEHRRPQLEALARKSQRLPVWLQCLQEARVYCGANVNTRLLLQDLFLKLRR